MKRREVKRRERGTHFLTSHIIHTLHTGTAVQQNVDKIGQIQFLSESIKKGNYIPEKNIEHNLIGSINNLCLEEIRAKMKNYFN